MTQPQEAEAWKILKALAKMAPADVEDDSEDALMAFVELADWAREFVGNVENSIT